MSVSLSFSILFSFFPTCLGYEQEYSKAVECTCAGPLCKALLGHEQVKGETLRFSHHGCEFSMTMLEMRGFMDKE